MAKGIRVEGPSVSGGESVLTPEALALVEKLHRTFDGTRKALLENRAKRQAALFDKGQVPDFLPETAGVRSGNWKVAPTPADLQKRHVEITGPTERKMMINALNSGADVFMADFEDSLSPTWSNIVLGQQNCSDAIRRTIEFKNPDGKTYKLKDKTATLLVRPRGWHLDERHVTVDGVPVSGSLFDFGVYFARNVKALIERGAGPYFYLPKMESHLEARLWNDVFRLAQDELKVPQGTIRATVLIETLPAAFEMDEILYELRDHMSGLNAGRWDYMFSLIKKLRNRKDLLLPDRVQITMTVPFMRAYTELLVKTCHRRAAHAMGGMSPFIPSRKNAEVNEKAMAQVRADKLRETNDGFDGTWVAHPDLVPIAREAFDKVLGQKANQKEKLREEVSVQASQLTDTRVPGGKITEAGFRLNISVALQYLNQWLLGNGAAAINNLMEDAATAEISRAQLWQWMKNGATLDDGRKADRALYQSLRDEEVVKLGGPKEGRYKESLALLDELVDTSHFHDFLTTIAYPRLD